MTIYRLISKHPQRYGCNETAHKSMEELNKSMEELKTRGFTEFSVDSFVRWI